MFYGGEVLDGTYQIVEEIGKGGTGVVYKAYHLRLKKYVVVKKLKESMAGKEEIRIEVDILKSLHHMYLPQVYDFLETGDQIYTIMDYIEGKDFQYYLDEGFTFEEKQLVVWMKQLCDVLDYLHSQMPPILHSDIKPGNIMVTPEGNICLIDFNISIGGEHKADLVGLSQWYAAPEQYEKAQLFMAHQDSSKIVLDARMDIYSLGASFYSLMSGRLPDMASPDYLPLGSMELPYSSAFVNIVQKTMAEQPKRRYQSAAALKAALDNIYKMDTVYRRLQRRGWVLAGVCGVCVVAGALNCLYGWQNMCREAYREAYQKFYDSASEYEDKNTISIGLDILNEKKFQDILEKNPQDKAEIFYSIGNVYYGLDDYENAIEYYENAAEEYPDSAYYRDQVIAAIKRGDIDQAKAVLRKAAHRGISDEELVLAQQETAFADGDMDKVIEITDTLKNSRSSEIAGYSCLMGAKAYKEKGLYDKQAEYLEQAYALGSDRRCLRELGSTYLELAKGESGSYGDSYLKKAEECYEKIQKSYAASYADRLNLAITEEMLGKYKESEKQLLELSKEYPNSYEIYMHLSYVNLKEQETLKSENRNYSKALGYYSKAEQNYRKAGYPEDKAMSELSEYMQELERRQ